MFLNLNNIRDFVNQLPNDTKLEINLDKNFKEVLYKLKNELILQNKFYTINKL